jgi:vacuolar iron transporter family protein
LEDSNRIADLYATNKQAFVNIMMLEELQLVKVDPIVAIKCGVVTFFSFLIFGVLPVLPYIVTSGIMKNDSQPWIASICIGAAELFTLGLIKAVIIGQDKIKAGMEILIIGALATAIGYGIGLAFPGQ